MRSSLTTRRQFAAGAALLGMASLFGVVSPLQAEEDAQDTWTCDVVVLGAGGAGCAAAALAAQNGASVIVVEKEPWLAGSSSLAIGSFYGAGTQIQKAAGVDDTPDALLQYFLSRGGDQLDYDVQKFCADHFGETIDWLTQDLGVEFKEGVVCKSVDTVPRCHTCANGDVRALEHVRDYAVEQGVDFRFSTSATELVCDDNGAVIGAMVTTKDGEPVFVSAQKTIVATGGFCRNPQMIATYMPDYADVYTEVGIGCTGEGLQMGLDIGAAYLGHGGTNGILACPVEPGQSKLIAANALWVTSNGERFAAEDGQTHDIYYDVAHFDDQTFYAVYDQALVDSLSDELKEKLQLGLDLGIFAQGDTVADAAAVLGLDGDAIEQTLADYNALAADGEDTAFNKKPENLVALETAPYYLLKMGVCTHGSFGGYSVNSNLEALNVNGDPIENLYAVGEVSSGSFIYDDYPGGGCGLSWAYTSGRCAGENAALAIDTFVSDPTPNDGAEEVTADLNAIHAAIAPATEGMAFAPHSEKHGDIDCSACHSTQPQTLFCTTCHNDAQVPEGWAIVEDGAHANVA